MNQPQVEAFFLEVKKDFAFLQKDYGYMHLNEYIKDPDDLIDTSVRSTYVSADIGVEVWWYIADAAIGVTFIELQQKNKFPDKASLYPQNRADIARAINLYTLAEVQSVSDDPDFLLKDPNNYRKHKMHARLIESNMPDIVAGLARATQKHAAEIIKGNTRIFPTIMEYYQAKK